MGSRPRCVVVGLGGWGRRLLPRVAQQFEVAAIVSTGSSASVAWSAKNWPGTPHLSSLRDAFAVPAIDAVFLASPTRTHAELSCQALEAGCHVFVEKPLAVDAASAAQVVDLARRVDREVFIGYIFLFHRALEFLHAFAPAEQLRGLHFEWVRAPERLRGPLHEELLCHDLAVTIALAGELPERVVVEDSDGRLLRSRFELASGLPCTSSLQLRDDMLGRRVVNIHYSQGLEFVWLDNHLYSQGGIRGELLGSDSEDALAREVRAFRAAVEGMGPRMIDDERLSVGIGNLLAEIGRSIGA